MVTLVGEHPLAKEDGNLKHVIANVFPAENAIVTGIGTHGGLVWDYIDHVNEERATQGLEPLTKEELASLEDRLYDSYVPLYMRENSVLIKPNCSKMDLAFAADELLQEIVPKEQIRFLGVLDERVRKAIKKRGGVWRMNHLPKTTEEMEKMISDAKTAISKRAHHNMETGTRYLTYAEFVKLGDLDNKELAKFLQKIKNYCFAKNDGGHQELRFFMADEFNLNEYEDEDFTKWDEVELRFHYEALKSKFESAVKPEFRTDDPENEEWREEMFSRLIGEHDEEISEEVLLGLCPEFYMHIQWLPGARIEHGEVIFDSVFEKEKPDEEKIYDEKVRDIILNFKREYGNIEYINVGRIIGSASKREKMPGRREVYIAEIKVKGKKKEEVKIIRMQKWGAVEYLESGEETNIHKAICRAYEYKRYILNRYRGCKQLGMALPERITPGEILEIIDGVEAPLIYYVRGYIDGRASDKIPASKLENKEYALRFAKFLGAAAAPNLIAGRTSSDRKKVFFDDGDEIIIENKRGMPSKIIIADHTGSFNDYTTPLEKFAEAYAQPIIKRADLVPDAKKFAQAYVNAFVKRFKEVQQEYRSYIGAFDTLFKDRKYDPKGSFAYRWEKVLERLDNTDASLLGDLIMNYITREIKI